MRSVERKQPSNKLAPKTARTGDEHLITIAEAKSLGIDAIGEISRKVDALKKEIQADRRGQEISAAAETDRVNARLSDIEKMVLELSQRIESWRDIDKTLDLVERKLKRFSSALKKMAAIASNEADDV